MEEEQRGAKATEIFAATVRLAPEARTEFLEQACGDDLVLRRAVEALLDERAKGARDAGPGAAERTRTTVARGTDGVEGAPARIGPYQIARVLGRGGMGAVYLAERDDEQFRKRVAIKLLAKGMDTEELVARFRRERQILAALDHENIARLLDGGATESGLPYLVMEYVEGQPIDQYADSKKLSIPERLTLFRSVCRAVAFAHQNLVVHRDIKPSNIFVTTSGVPKLLDFGIAKLINPDLAGDVELTRQDHRVMTPEYASPEQVRGEPVTTATDVYSLGVVLYQLLTGLRPYRITGTQLSEITRVVCEEQPLRPSAALSRLETASAPAPAATGAGAVAASRFQEGSLRRVRRRLRGDLDNIVLMALRKEPQRRYASVAELSEDIGRALAGRPVRARKDTLRYRTGKFVKRNRVPLAAASLVFATIAGAVAATLREARVAERRFADVRQLANSFLFDFHDAIAKLPGSTPARELVVGKALEYLGRLSRESGSDPSLTLELAAAYLKVGDIQGNPNTSNLGRPADALASYQAGVALLESLLRQRPADDVARGRLVAGYARASDVLQVLGRTPDALAFARKAKDAAEAMLAEKPSERELRERVAAADERVADLLVEVGDAAGGLSLMQQALAVRRALADEKGAGDEALAQLGAAHERLASMLERTGDTGAALDSLRRSRDILETLASDPNDVPARRRLAIAHARIADLLADSGDLAAAVPSLEQGLEVFQAIAAADPRDARAQRDLALTHKKMGDLQTSLGDPRKAMASYRAALAIRETRVREAPASAQARKEHMISLNDIGDTLGHPDFPNLGDPQGALRSYRRALMIAEQEARKDPGNVRVRDDLFVSLTKVGRMLEVTGDRRGALALYRRALPMAEALASEDPENELARQRVGISHELLGGLLRAQGRLGEARSHHEQALALRLRIAEANPSNAEAQAQVAISYGALGDVAVDRAARATSREGQLAQWQAARRSFAKGLEIWRRLGSAVQASDAAEAERVSLALLRCDARLAGLQDAAP